MLARRMLSDNLFNSLFDPFETNTHFVRSDYVADSNGFSITLNVPGYGKEDLEVYIENKMLVVATKEENPVLLKRYLLQREHDTDSIDVKCDKGVLKITGKNLTPKIDKKILPIN